MNRLYRHLAAASIVLLAALSGPPPSLAVTQVDTSRFFVKDFEELARSLKSGSALKYSYDHELALHETLLRASGEIA